MKRKNKLSRLLEPGFRLYFIVLVCFVAATAALQNWYLAGAEAAAVVALYLYFRRSNDKRRRDILKYIDSVSSNIDVATKDTMVNAPLPMVIFRPESGEVIWSNERFLQLTGQREHLFDTKLDAAVPDFNSRWLMEGKSECPNEVRLGDRRYRVFGHLVRTDDSSRQSFLATSYWVDVTDLADLRDRFHASRPVAAIVMIDNYEEGIKSLSDSARSVLFNGLNACLDSWAAPTNGLFCRYDRDRYLLIFEEQYFPAMQGGKFAVLDAVRSLEVDGAHPASLSIGIGKDADSLEELFRYAALAIDMAQSRGGDQVVVKNRINFEFYGGKVRETERHTKVKSRVMAGVLNKLVADASQVFITGHKFPDLDCVGAAAGVCAIARKLGVNARIIREPGANPASVMLEKLAALPEYAQTFISAQDALLIADANALLVVVDTNRPEQVYAEDLLASCNKVAVIDHHRRASSYIEGAALNFHEPYASSASELVTELLQYIMEPAGLLRTEAEALLAGIVLDTKQFTLRTGGRTFEAAAFLRRSGADTGEVRKLFQSDLEGAISRYNIIQNARLYKSGIAIAKVDHSINRVTAAQAADELLNIAGIQASFVLFPDGERVIISARSMGDINVQVILEKLGGGGNAATAGAQVPNPSVDEVFRMLLPAIDQCLAEE